MSRASWSFARCGVLLVASAVLLGRAGADDSVDGENPASPTPEQVEFFETQVRPILVEHCYECHSAESGEIEAGLRLDSKPGWQSGGDSGPAVLPGDASKSLLIHAVRYEEDVVSGMPPDSKLPDKQIALLEKWVTMGAPDPRTQQSPPGESMVESFDLQKRFREHWSWRPITSPAPPRVADSSWPLNDIDKFVLRRIEDAGLAPAPTADRAVWLRRVYFDLIGLPPTESQLAEFLADEADDAHQRVVDDLLGSVHFGEKWARHWMDLVRYAETYGHEFDYPIRFAHEYRDYLIRAYNADVPFDQFVREHIAGDLIAQPRIDPASGINESVIGTGFWYFHEATHAPTDVLANEADIVDNQLDVFGKAFLGLTVACARCHDHKFDAISTADYYALSAHLQSSCRQDVPLDAGGTRAKALPRIRSLLGEAQTQLTSAEIDVPAPVEMFDVANELLLRRDSAEEITRIPDEWIAAAADAHRLDSRRLNRWVGAIQSGPPPRARAAKDSVLFEDFESGAFPDGWSTSGLAFTPVGSDLRLRADGSIANPGTIDSGVSGKKQTGILRSPTFEIAATQIHVRMRATADVTVRVIIDNYHMAHFNALLFKQTYLNDKATDTGGQWIWKSLANDLRKYVGHKAFLEFVDEGDGDIAIDEIRFSERKPRADSRGEIATAGELREPWRNGINAIRRGRSTPLIRWMVRNGLVDVEQLSADAGRALSEARTIADSLPAPRFAVAMAQGTPEDAFVYVRGNHATLGDRVPARTLEALGSHPGTRLDLADQITSRDNPLTARVFVNRVWHHLMGRGIVPSVDDFGPQGEPPSHPELLDWLASEFVADDWSVKRLIRRVVLSQTYRQDAVADPSLDIEKIATVDPTNSLLYRMRIRRLPSESIRDAILLVSGRLDPKPFGPSVPTHRTPFMSGRGARASGPLDGNGRRSIYLSIYRNFLSPFMLTFDMPNPFGPKGRRSQSNVPAQALTLMNDPLVIQQSETWAKRIFDAAPEGAAPTDRARVAAMVRQAHGIEASEGQLDQLLAFLRLQASQYGDSDQRAWADLGHALFNMKAFYFLR